MVNQFKKNVLYSVKWTSLVTLLNTLIQPFYRILLAILLLPSEFGYIAVITLIVSFAELLNNIGIGEALIQKDSEEVSVKDLSTLFFFNVIISSIISIILFISASFIESFYNLPDLELMVKLITLIVFLSGITSIFKFYLHKNFQFKQTSMVKMIKIISEVSIALLLIYIGYNIWGFLWGIIVANILNSLLLTVFAFKMTDFKIELYFSFNNLKSYLNFGVFVSFKKIITFISQRIDEIIIGGVLSAEILGVYFLAKNLLVQLQTLITTSFGQVLLPTFSKIKNDLWKQRRIYLKIVSILFFLGTPIFLMIILSAELFVPLIFGEEWARSSEVFQWLSLPTFCLVLSAGVTTSVLYSQAKTFTVLLIDLIMVPLYVISLVILHNHDLYNIMFIYTSYIIMKFLIIQIVISKVLHINFKDYLGLFKRTFASGIITGSLLYGFLMLPFDVNPYIYLILFLCFGAIIYFIINWLINRCKMIEYYTLIKEIIRPS